MSSKRSNKIKKKYIGYYIGFESLETGECGTEYYETKYPTIEDLTRSAEADGVYIVLRKIHPDWLEQPFKEWCIWRVYMSKEILLKHCKDAIQVNDRIYKINDVFNISYW